MSGRPRVFLSHSKRDRAFIERLASDLRLALIDVWYDDWEIPPGDSLRRRILSEGIPESDLFFIYITDNSLSSYWCERELDAAFIQEVEQRCGNLAIFADGEASRARLSPDLRALRIPIADDSTYERSVRLVVSSAWRAHAIREVGRAHEKLRLRLAEAEKQVTELQLQLERTRSAGTLDFRSVAAMLDEITFAHGGMTHSLRNLFASLANLLATGANHYMIRQRLNELFQLGSDAFAGVDYETSFAVYDIIGPLIVNSLVEVRPPNGEWNELFYLTDLGKDLLRDLQPAS